MEFTLEKVTNEDFDAILELGESVNEEHVVPLLNAEGQKAIELRLNLISIRSKIPKFIQ